MEEGMWMNTEGIMALMVLAREGGRGGEVSLSLGQLAKHLGVSKQTASRRLEELERERMITRKTGPKGQVIRISSTGMAALRGLYRELEKILEAETRPIELSGTVITGLGEGGYYLSREGYAKQLEEKLGFRPYPGTLDIKLDEKSLHMREVLLRMPMGEVKGFRTKEREFGPVRFVKAKIDGRDAAILFPERTHHSDVIEVIAQVNLRRALGLEDGSRVKVVVG
ncbi:MAG: DUF120 domain-containing protein [Candidatus Hadarchaeales archaeon]